MRLAWISAALAIGFVALAIYVAQGAGDRVDLWITLEVQRATALDDVFRVVSYFGNFPVDTIVPTLAIVALAAWGRRLDAACLAVSVVGAALLTVVVKLAFARPRPAAPVHLLELASGDSFPSGHVTQYVALFGFLALVTRTRMRPSLLRAAIVAALVALVVAVGPSRVYLGAHWSSDVVGGYLLAGCWVALVGRTYLARVDATRTMP